MGDINLKFGRRFTCNKLKSSFLSEEFAAARLNKYVCLFLAWACCQGAQPRYKHASPLLPFLPRTSCSRLNLADLAESLGSFDGGASLGGH